MAARKIHAAASAHIAPRICIRRARYVCVRGGEGCGDSSVFNAGCGSRGKSVRQFAR